MFSGPGASACLSCCPGPGACKKACHTEEGFACGTEVGATTNYTVESKSSRICKFCKAGTHFNAQGQCAPCNDGYYCTGNVCPPLWLLCGSLFSSLFGPLFRFRSTP